ncbi:hypothetical protein UFOVP1351_44 [uncultured Caudovirales phage]|uniref:Uncharacterized protein n=1 Tax=uncultured Caudovirales phage TaxID=2100421 RepID=A0A6J5S4A2_9CAUD|nr:hypothetical protein UFOVP1351_44 [uncultured Caudovirales phage]
MGQAMKNWADQERDKYLELRARLALEEGPEFKSMETEEGRRDWASRIERLKQWGFNASESAETSAAE